MRRLVLLAGVASRPLRVMVALPQRMLQRSALLCARKQPIDPPLTEGQTLEHSTEMYTDLVKSLLAAGNVKDASDVLEQMGKQGFVVRRGLCNLVMGAWLEQGTPAGYKAALHTHSLIKVPPNDAQLAMFMVAVLALAGKPAEMHDQLSSMLGRCAKTTAGVDPAVVGSYFRQFAKSNTQTLLDTLKGIKWKSPDTALLVRHIMTSVTEAGLREARQAAPVVRAPPVDEEKEMDPTYQEQLNLETRAATDAVVKYRNSLQSIISLGRGANTGPVKDVLLLWYEPLVREIAEEHRKIGAGDVGLDRSVYGAKLLTVDAERLAVITIHEALGMLMANPSGVRFTTLALAIGSAVQAEAFFTKSRQDSSQLVSFMRSNGVLLTVNTVNKAARYLNREGATEEGGWGVKLQAKIGSVLVEALLRSARIPPNLSYEELVKRRKLGDAGMTAADDWTPAFRHGYRWLGKKRLGTIYCLPEVLETIEQGHSLRETVNARYLPMLVPPRPWTSPSVGGYLAYSNWVMRTKGSEQQRKALTEAPMQPVYRALDILGSTPWTINTFVLGVVRDAWEKGGGILDLPSQTDLTIPTPPSSFPEEDPKARKRFLAFQRRVIQQQRDLHGLRCALKYQLDIANEFKDRVIYFPHNLDFRGRSYPLPPHLNQMGSDLCRGLMRFAEAKPLGPRGVHWLKIHLANLYGNDKITHEERVRFIDANMDAVRLATADPLGTGSWWKTADSPWQTLAVCKALIDALDSGNPEAYMCNVPVHQDGSCNGLQHYAALGGDVLGAEQVNLLPRSAPQDVYGGVARLVAQRVADDASKGVRLGELLLNKVDRKIVKQTVMTSVYGVTFVGARKQIYNAMRNRIALSEEDSYLASAYLTRHTFAALQEMFIAAREIQTWLGECARRIAKAGHPVTWVTPLGLPVMQPYRRAGRSAVVTLVQTIILEDQNDKMPVNVARQKSAFAPNFVHSLDSTHMMLTAHAVNKEGITFASVHDSFWTHPCDVDRMNVLLRESFVALHSEPLLQQLLQHFKRAYPEVALPAVPARGQLDLEQVRHSPYFFH